MCRKCAQETALQIKLEEERDQEKLIYFVEDYCELTPTYEQKGTRKLYHDFNTQ